jgi:hypothetical protein
VSSTSAAAIDRAAASALTAPAARPGDEDRRFAALSGMPALYPADSRADAMRSTVDAGPHMVPVFRRATEFGDWEPLADPHGPRVWAFLIDGFMTTGTLAEYAVLWADAQADGGGSVSDRVMAWGGVAFGVRARCTGADEHGDAVWALSVGEETATTTVPSAA